ncbi:MAG: TetR/AcrR family transcriptional regulator [Lentilitoribacter sp.]
MNIENVSRQRGSEEVWLNAAYEMLRENGIEAVKVMPLAKKLGLTRTSFYWHFTDRDALLEAMIRRWEQKNTGNLINQTKAFAEAITEAMLNVFDCWLDENLFDARMDLAIRNWARNNKELQSRLDLADARRADALFEMFKKFGYDDAQAQARSMTVIYTQIGYISMEIHENQVERISRMPDYIAVFTGETPSHSEFERFKARHRDLLNQS